MKKCRSLAALEMTLVALGITLVAFGMTAVFASSAAAQTSGEVHLRRLLGVPIGALPPVASLMPASRNHNYFVARVQGGRLTGSAGDRDAIGAGMDIQWRGGSSFGATAGYQRNECAVAADCPDHVMFGGRALLNLITGGPTFAALVGDASATTTLGTEIGLGYAPNAYRGDNACAVDVAMPLSISMFQVIRVVAFGAPGIAWDIPCSERGNSAGAGVTTLAKIGLGLHQIGARGLDITFGAQKLFRAEAGVHVGITVTYVRLR